MNYLPTPSIVILIPSLKPDQKLIDLVSDLQGQANCPICIVDDGSGPDYAELFNLLETKYHCHILHHPVNQGKGMALKTGLHYIVNSFSHLSGVVTADADGQHRPKDILAIGEKIGKEKNEFLVGSRDFSLPQVPWKSRWGNRITSFIFKWVTGTTCHDTQTGLRGIPMDLIPLALGVNGARYEYEMNVLLQFGHHHIFIREIPIETVYFGSNENSHFNSWRDSFRIYSNFIKIILSHSLPSILFGIADFATFLLLIFWFNSFDLGPIMLATFLSRTLTKLGTIGVTRPWTKKKANFSNIVLILSVLLFILEMVLSGLLVYFLTLALPALLVAKLLADIFLYGFVNLLKGVFVRLILRKKR